MLKAYIDAGNFKDYAGKRTMVMKMNQAYESIFRDPVADKSRLATVNTILSDFFKFHANDDER